jgi:hypothetical protein
LGIDKNLFRSDQDLQRARTIDAGAANERFSHGNPLEIA